jgi:hypothetical protein
LPSAITRTFLAPRRAGGIVDALFGKADEAIAGDQRPGVAGAVDQADRGVAVDDIGARGVDRERRHRADITGIAGERRMREIGAIHEHNARRDEAGERNQTKMLAHLGKPFRL